eukprot:scaffold31464_cov31-Tisochrysis_lutea.AAC.3
MQCQTQNDRTSRAGAGSCARNPVDPGEPSTIQSASTARGAEVFGEVFEEVSERVVGVHNLQPRQVWT